MTYSIDLSRPLREWREALIDWSVREVRPLARWADQHAAMPPNGSEVLDKLTVGVGRRDIPDGLPIPRFPEGDWVTSAVKYEAMSAGDGWGNSLVGHGIGELVVKALGTPEQVERWYEPAHRDNIGNCFALTEPQFGSDTSKVATTATRDGDTWILNGAKMYCTGFLSSEWVVVFATVDKSLGGRGIRAFVLRTDTPGIELTKPNESKMGLRYVHSSSFVLDHVAVPTKDLLGWSPDAPDELPGVNGLRGALGALSRNRPNVGMMAIAAGQASLDVTTAVLHEQRHGFTPQRWSFIQQEFARMNAALERGRRAVYISQTALDRGTPDQVLPSVAKAYSPQTVDRVIRRCLQFLGPDGTSKDLLVEKWYRDVKIMDIFEGSSQIQRLIVARSLMGRAVG